jgi:hypothetical protein
LIARSFDADVSGDPTAAARWQQPSEVLHKGDHYILVMIDEAVGSRSAGGNSGGNIAG